MIAGKLHFLIKLFAIVFLPQSRIFGD